MPSEFSQFRYLDAKGGPPPKVRFQAQRKDKDTGQWTGSKIIERQNLSHGAIYRWEPSAGEPWQAPVWNDHDGKRIVVQEIRIQGGQPVEIGYVIEQDTMHPKPVVLASLAIWGPATAERSGWLMAPGEWAEDPDVESDPWGTPPMTFLPEPP